MNSKINRAHDALSDLLEDPEARTPDIRRAAVALCMALVAKKPKAKKPKAKKAYVYVQEGGSSTELYLHAWGTTKEAHAGRVSCAEGAYRTGPVIEVPAELDTLGEVFYSTVEEIFGSLGDLECVEGDK